MENFLVYKNSRICSLCGFEEVRFLSEMKAAFEETRKWESACPNCRISMWISSFSLPDLNYGQMEKWSHNEQLHFYDQDEELFLSHKENLHLLVRYLDDDKTLESKKKIIFEALCILFYRNIHQKIVDRDQCIAQTVKQILSERINLFSKVENDKWFVRDNIKEIIYPELGLDYKESYVNSVLLSKDLKNEDIIKSISLSFSVEPEAVAVHESDIEYHESDVQRELDIVKTKHCGNFPLLLDIYGKIDVTDEHIAKIFISLFHLSAVIIYDENANDWFFLKYPECKEKVKDEKLLRFLTNYF